jgi:hypothetical protein
MWWDVGGWRLETEGGMLDVWQWAAVGGTG